MTREIPSSLTPLEGAHQRSLSAVIVLMAVVLTTTMIDSTHAFTALPPPRTPTTTVRSRRLREQHEQQRQQQQQQRRSPLISSSPSPSSSSTLWVVADAQGEDIRKGRKRERNENNNKNNSDTTYDHVVDDDDEEYSVSATSPSWIPTASGGFLPNLAQRFRLPGRGKQPDELSHQETAAVRPQQHPLLQEVVTLQDYKREVIDVGDYPLVCVRFYAPWCKACQAVAGPFQRLARQFAGKVKFVQMPMTEDNAFVANGLGVPSLPFCHLYHTQAGLVEERSLNKKVFKEFAEVLQTYVNGYCVIDWQDELQ